MRINQAVLTLAVAVGGFAFATASAVAADVGVSVSVGQPGFYGQIDIGNFPQPRVIYPQPVVIQPVPVAVAPEPIYLHVPPGHEKNWRKHCHQYDACNRPVYFVHEDWYSKVYVPRYREEHYRDEHYREGRYREDHEGEHHAKGHGRGHDED